jgi:hypothetical protein
MELRVVSWFSMELAYCHPSGAWNSKVTPRFLENLICSFMAPTKALYINTILYRFYMFRRHLRRRQRALCQDLKLTKV